MNKTMFYVGIGSGIVTLVAVIATVSLTPVTLQTAVQVDGSDTSHVTKHEEWIEWYRNADADELGHYHNQIVRDTWVAQYEFEQEFHPEDGFVVEYLSALVIQQEILQGTYDYGDEKLIRYHNWLLEEFDVPDTLKGVEQAMLDLVGGDPASLYRIDHVHYHNHRATMIAEPPFDLWESDPDWWGLQNRLSACQYNVPSDCDEFIWAYENNRPLTDEELELMQPAFDEAAEQWRADKKARGNGNGTGTASTQSWDLFPKAEALIRVDIHNTLTMRASSSACDAARCTVQSSVSGTGDNDLSLPNPTWHVIGDASVSYAAWVTASKANGALSQGVSVSGEIDQPGHYCPRSSTGTYYAAISCSMNPPGQYHVYEASSHSSAHAYYN